MSLPNEINMSAGSIDYTTLFINTWSSKHDYVGFLSVLLVK